MSVLSGAMMSMGRTLEKLGTALYSPECVEGFSEVRFPQGCSSQTGTRSTLRMQPG